MTFCELQYLRQYNIHVELGLINRTDLINSQNKIFAKCNLIKLRVNIFLQSLCYLDKGCFQMICAVCLLVIVLNTVTLHYITGR